MNTRLSSFFIAVVLCLLFSEAFAQQGIAGTWQGELQLTPDTAIKLRIILADAGNGNYTGEINSTDSPAFKNVPVTQARLSGDRLRLRADAIGVTYEGSLEKGRLKGTWSQPGREIPLNLTPFVRAAVSAEMQTKLSGSWLGMLKAPNGAGLGQQQIKFSTDDEGNFSGRIRGINNPWTDFSQIVQSGEEIEMHFPSGGTYFQGTVDDDDFHVYMINSDGVKFELDMTRGDYAPPSIQTNLSDSDRQRLIGSWFGEIRLPNATVPVAYFFNESVDEGFTGVRRINPYQNNNTAIRIREVNLKDGKLVITPMAGDGEFVGEFNGKTITGETYTPLGPAATTVEKRE